VTYGTCDLWDLIKCPPSRAISSPMQMQLDLLMQACTVVDKKVQCLPAGVYGSVWGKLNAQNCDLWDIEHTLIEMYYVPHQFTAACKTIQLMENYCLEVTWTVVLFISTLCMQGARDEWKLYTFYVLLVPKCNRVHIVYFMNEWGYSKY
jgi:hypothetical protein